MLTTSQDAHASTASHALYDKHSRTVLRQLRFGLLASLFGAGAALAGPIWEEPPISDAGSTPKGAQVTRGDSGFGNINGNLGGGGGLLGGPIMEGDFQDMFLIQIIDPAAFIASTAPDLGGAADFTPSLWLFNANGTGLLGTLQNTADKTGATLVGVANDGSGAAVVDPGYYFIAIAGSGSYPLANFPKSPDSVPIFAFLSPGEISGPDGPGGTLPIGSWHDSGQTGSYSIALQGVGFAAPACRSDLNFDGIVDADDLGLLLSEFGCNGGCWTDINENGIVDADDLGILLTDFGTQCGPIGSCCLPSGECEVLTVYECLVRDGVFSIDATPCSSSACTK